MFEERPKSRERNFSQEFETRTEICITPRKSQKSTSKEKKPANSNQTLFCLNLLEPAAAKKRKMKVIIKRKNSETNKPERWLEDELRGKNDSHIFVVRGSKIL